MFSEAVEYKLIISHNNHNCMIYIMNKLRVPSSFSHCRHIATLHSTKIIVTNMLQSVVPCYAHYTWHSHNSSLT
jgi:hypothetical protein